MLGKTEGKTRRGQRRMRGLDSIIDSVDMNMNKFWEIVKDRGVGHAVGLGVAKITHDRVTKRQQRHHVSNCAGWCLSMLSPSRRPVVSQARPRTRLKSCLLYKALF